MPAFEMQSVCKDYGAVHACQDVDLQVASGERVVLLGRSGSGKTTILRLLAGLEHPTRGRVLFGSRDASQLPPAQRNVALVSQDYPLYPQLTVRQNMHAATRGKCSGRKNDEHIEEVLNALQIRGVVDRLPSELSGGQMQRVALAKAVVRSPQLLLLDEPLSQIDAVLRDELRELILKIVEQYKMTLVMVTHDSQDALRIATRIAIIDDGRILQVGKTEEVYQYPQTVIAGELVSPFGMNWIDSEALPAPFLAHLSREMHSKSIHPVGSSQCLIGFRPEQVVVRRGGENDALRQDQFEFRASIVGIRSLGFARLGIAEFGNRRLRVLDWQSKLRHGPLTLGVHAKDCVQVAVDASPECSLRATSD